MRTLTYWQHAVECAGIEVEPRKWHRNRLRSVEVEEQTKIIADRLRSAGIAPERKTDGILSLVGVATGKAVTLTGWRHINFLPAVSAANRSQLVKRLSFFAESRACARACAHNARARARGPNQGSNLRYLVVTNGKRCPIGELRQRLIDLARSISRYAADDRLKAFGVTVELRVSELTAERDTEGQWTYHPHANVVIDCQRFIDWKKFLAFTTAALPGHWRDNGRLVDANEAVKYFVKPSDVLEHTPGELGELFRATFGLRLVTPMGAFKALGCQMMRDRVKLAKKLDVDRQNWEWCFVKKNATDAKQPAKSKQPNLVMGCLPSQPRFTNRFEPCLLVRDYGGNLEKLLADNRLTDLFAPARAAWCARSAIRFTPSPQLSDEKPHKPRRTYELLRT